MNRATLGANRYGLKTVTTWRQAGRLRVAGLATGIAAALAMIVVGCSGVTQGTATIDKADAPEYRASASASSEASVSSSAAREAERQAAIVKDAVHAACDALGSTADESVDAVNAYVQAYNAETPDAPAKAGPAMDSLNRSADSVSGSLSDPLPTDLRTSLNGWVDAARQLAGVISRNEGPDAFNGAIRQLNDSKTAAGAGCDAAY